MYPRRDPPARRMSRVGASVIGSGECQWSPLRSFLYASRLHADGRVVSQSAAMMAMCHAGAGRSGGGRPARRSLQVVWLATRLLDQVGRALVDGSGPAHRWKDERHGARTGRGIHFQDAAVTWLAAKVAAGHIPNVLVVPEGSEDVLLEGGAQWHVQVKSRVERRGLFSASQAAGHILGAWGRHASRDEAGSRLVVMLESGVEGETPSNDLNKTLAESLADRLATPRQA